MDAHQAAALEQLAQRIERAEGCGSLVIATQAATALRALLVERGELKNEVHDVRAAFEGSRAIIATLQAERDELAKDAGRLREALARVVDADWAYLGREADTGNPDSLYNRVRAGRAALTNKD